jgi:peptidyl-prolyl cis-trans isomerase SurA
MMLQGMMRLKFLIVSLSITLATWAQSSPEGVVIDKIIAKVDDYVVLKSDLARAYLDYLSSGQPRSQASKCRILESLVVNKMMVAKAEIDSVIIEESEVLSNLDRRMDIILQNIGSREEVENAYGKTLEEIREELFDPVREQLIIQRMQRELTSDIEVSPAEVKAFFARIPRDSLPYFSTEVQVAQIVKEPEPNEGQEFRVRQQLKDLRDLIKSGSSFASFARRYSEDRSSATQGGMLPYYSRGDLAPEFEAAAMTLEEGEISEPVKTDFGYHLIELIDRRGNTFKTRHILIRPKPDASDMKRTEDYLDSLRNAIELDSIAFQAAAKEYSDDQATSSNGGFFSDQNTGSLFVSVDALDPNIFFAIDTMEIGTISKPMKFRQPDGTEAYRILYYKAKTPPHLANLDDDYQKIAKATLTSKQNKRLNEWFLDAKDEIFIDIDPEYDNCDLLKD